MSRKLLITSGCSWTAGSSRMNQKYVWPIILSKKLDMDCVNVGKGGVGNEYIYNRIIDKLCTTKRIGLAICLWTDFDRWDFYSSTFQLQPKFRHGELFNLVYKAAYDKIDEFYESGNYESVHFRLGFVDGFRRYSLFLLSGKGQGLRAENP